MVQTVGSVRQGSSIAPRPLAIHRRANSVRSRSSTCSCVPKKNAERERQRADEATQRAELLAEKLRALGIDPEEL